MLLQAMGGASWWWSSWWFWFVIALLVIGTFGLLRYTWQSPRRR